MIHPIMNPDAKPQIVSIQRGICLFDINPDTSPITPKANICHGVHAPCPKYILEVRAIIVPIKNPVSGPLTIAPIIKINNSGLAEGSAANKTRPPTAKAQIIAIKTISREFLLECSNFTK